MIKQSFFSLLFFPLFIFFSFLFLLIYFFNVPFFLTGHCFHRTLFFICSHRLHHPFWSPSSSLSVSLISTLPCCTLVQTLSPWPMAEGGTIGTALALPVTKLTTGWHVHASREAATPACIQVRELASTSGRLAPHCQPPPPPLLPQGQGWEMTRRSRGEQVFWAPPPVNGSRERDLGSFDRRAVLNVGVWHGSS